MCKYCVFNKDNIHLGWIFPIKNNKYKWCLEFPSGIILKFKTKKEAKERLNKPFVV